MTIFLVRHGESVGNTRPGFLSGRQDKVGLTVLGQIQMVRLAWQLREESINTILTSPVVRAQQSAAILGRALKVPVKVKPIFTEVHHGIFENRYWWERKDKIPRQWWLKKREDFATPWPGGESFSDQVKRVEIGWQELLKTVKPKEHLVLVTHQAVVGTLVYLLRHGQINDPDAFMEAMHHREVKNGEAIKITRTKKGFLVDESPLPPVVPAYSRSRVFTYVKSLLAKTKRLRLVKIRTASQHKVFRLNGETSGIFKLLTGKGALSGQRLVNLYRYLESQVKIPAPRISHYDPSCLFFPAEVVILDYEPGQSARRCFLARHSGLVRVLHQAEKVLRQIHQIPVAQVKTFWYPDDWDGQHPSWSQYLKKEIDKTLKQLPRFKLVLQRQREIRAALEELKGYIQKGKSHLVPLHGDFSPLNLIVDHRQSRCQLVRVVDFERARIGDLLWDYAYFYGWLERERRGIAPAWQKILWKRLTPHQQKIFWQYRALFHAWTVRDGFKYRGSRLRQIRAKQSLKILRTG